MDFYRICLVFFHICSSLTYIPHLIIHISRLSFNSIPLRFQIAYTIYWVGYCILVIGVLIWCLTILYRKQTVWQVIQISAYVLIAKFFYTSFDVTVRILLYYRYIIILFDILHLIILIPAIIITFRVIQEIKNKNQCEAEKIDV
ncbi:hypothetical protein I4U23_007094 [Adineta vaga]|nr:hypothetical protein I4U23_007094 [Adineta vaga]